MVYAVEENEQKHGGAARPDQPAKTLQQCPSVPTAQGENQPPKTAQNQSTDHQFRCRYGQNSGEKAQKIGQKSGDGAEKTADDGERTAQRPDQPGQCQKSDAEEQPAPPFQARFAAPIAPVTDGPTGIRFAGELGQAETGPDAVHTVTSSSSNARCCLDLVHRGR